MLERAMLNNRLPRVLLSAALAALSLLIVPAASFAGAEEKTLALELVKLVTPREVYRDMLKQMTDNMMQAMQARGGAPTPDKTDKLVAALEDAMPYDELVQWTAEIYSARFSSAELKELLKFYKTPLGKKLAKSLPEIMGETGKKVGSVIPQRLPEALKKHGLAP
jgi:uncharacterized protein